MTQKIFGLGFGGVGIVAVLIIAGILLKSTNSGEIGSTAITAGVIIGIILGILGVIGVIISISKRF